VARFAESLDLVEAALASYDPVLHRDLAFGSATIRKQWH
jgi:hypothetical protein